jgi:hypothetical protein
VKNPGKDNMEIITKEGGKINKYTPSEDKKSSDKKGNKSELRMSWKMVKLFMFRSNF